MHHHLELHVRTQYDGKDLMSIEELYHLDNEGGQEVVCKTGTNACIDIGTCADQGDDLWSWLRSQVEVRLSTAGITYDFLIFDDEP